MDSKNRLNLEIVGSTDMQWDNLLTDIVTKLRESLETGSVAWTQTYVPGEGKGETEYEKGSVQFKD